MVINIVTVVLSVGILIDFTLSFKAALDLRSVLVGLEKVREEMERIQKRLDVIAAVTNDERETRRQERSERMNDLMDNIEERFNVVKERLKVNPYAYPEEVKEKIADLRSRYFVEKDHHLEFRKVRAVFLRGLIKGNPSMTSGKYAESLEALKKAIDNKKEKTDSNNRNKEDSHPEA